MSISMNRFSLLANVTLLTFCGGIQAQIITDGSVGAQITLDGTDVVIDEILGTRSGNNLFHSFQTFNIDDGGIATFTGASDIQNVISRVTGGEVSNIQGVLRSEIGAADFYFVNPAGVMFGSGGSVDVPASFHLSTANELIFSDQSVFSAIDPASSSLSTASPEAFGFLGGRSGDIVIDGARMQFTDESRVSLAATNIFIIGDPEIERSSRPRIEVAGGEVNLVAIGSGVAEVSLDGVGALPAENTGGNLVIENGVVRVDEGGGHIRLFARNIDLSGDNVHAVNDNDSARGGDVSVVADRLLITDSGNIFSDAESAGPAGNVSVTVTELIIDGVNSERGTGIQSDSIGSGSGGTVTIDAEELTLLNGGQIRANAFSSGNAGALDITTVMLTVDGNGLLQQTGLISESSSSLGDAGDAGQIELTVHGDINLFDHGVIATSSREGLTGAAGEIKITVGGSFLADGQGGTGDITGVANNAVESGSGGRILINVADDFILRSGASVQAQNRGGGDAGAVEVTAGGAVALSNGARLSTSAEIGDAGPISISSNRLLLIDGQITTSTNSQASTGGEIRLVNELLVMQEGFIQANAVNASGGEVFIESGGVVASSNTILGSEETARLTFGLDGPNVIQAVAPGGVNGLITVDSPELDVSAALSDLDSKLDDASNLIFDPCGVFVEGSPSSLISIGKGGLPSSDASGTYAVEARQHTTEKYDQNTDHDVHSTHMVANSRNKGSEQCRG